MRGGGANTPDPVDVFVGSRVRIRRSELKVTQQTLAERIGLTFQQVQKYERGTNRISVSTLFHIAQALKTPLDYFIEGLPSTIDGDAIPEETTRFAGALNREYVADITLRVADLPVRARKYVRDMLVNLTGFVEDALKERLVVDVDIPTQTPNQLPEEVRHAGSRRSPARLKLEHLAKRAMGSKATFRYGTFNTKSALQAMIGTVGGGGWAKIDLNATGYTVTKVKEPTPP